MADRVKYFMLGLLFLVVAGVIAYDRWNSRDGLPEEEMAEHERANSGKVFVVPPRVDEDDTTRPPTPIIIKPPPVDESKPYTPDIKPRPEPKPVQPRPVGRERVHIVKAGEALEKIAKDYYPGAIYKGIDLIVKVNRLRNANVIREGQKLIIPAMNASSSRRPVVVDSKKPAPAVTPVKKPKSGVPSVYVVKAKDGDLYKICRRFYGRNGEGERVARIMDANSLSSVNVKPGTRLKLPKK